MLTWKDCSGNKIAGKQDFAWEFWDIPAVPSMGSCFVHNAAMMMTVR